MAHNYRLSQAADVAGAAVALRALHLGLHLVAMIRQPIKLARVVLLTTAALLVTMQATAILAVAPVLYHLGALVETTPRGVRGTLGSREAAIDDRNLTQADLR